MSLCLPHPGDTDIQACAECGHLHFDAAARNYGACPLAGEGCRCPYADGGGSSADATLELRRSLTTAARKLREASYNAGAIRTRRAFRGPNVPMSDVDAAIQARIQAFEQLAALIEEVRVS